MVVLKFEIFSVTMLAIRVTVEWGSPHILPLAIDGRTPLVLVHFVPDNTKTCTIINIHHYIQD